MSGDARPVLFVTGHAPPERVVPFGLLAEREGAEFALFGGRSRHGAAEAGELPFPHLRVRQRDVHGLAASGAYRAVVCGTVGRVAVPAAFAGARRAGVPFLLWSALWSHPLSPAGLAGWLPMRAVYRGADALVAYGPHVAEYARARGARNVHLAPQAVDNAFWSEPVAGTRPEGAKVVGVFTGRLAREKGVQVLLRAWRASGLRAPYAALVLVGGGPVRARTVASSAARLIGGGPSRARAAAAFPGDPAAGIHAAGPRPPAEVRNFYAGADVLVVPSLATLAFREPWGLVVNEAMNQGLPVIASDRVGAAAGGLVRHERNGLVVPAGDATALASALRRLADDPGLRDRLGAAARRDVAAYTFDAWVDGFSGALASVSASRGG